MQTTKQYFEAFFDEKDIDPDETFEFEINETWHLMSYGVVIETVKQTRDVEANNIAAILRRIDFANGDVKHFLRHLGLGLAGATSAQAHQLNEEMTHAIDASLEARR